MHNFDEGDECPHCGVELDAIDIGCGTCLNCYCDLTEASVEE